MNAVKFRNLMLVGIALTIVVMGGFIYYASNYLQEQKMITNHARIDAELSLQDIDKLKELEKTLQTHSDSVKKAEQIVSESGQYEYQDQIVKDINAYAAKTGVSVIGYDFGDSNVPTSTTADPTIPKINGVKTLRVTLTLQSPMPFDNYLRFVKAIEQNLTKMQVSGINISPDEKDNRSITNPSVIILVYVR